MNKTVLQINSLEALERLIGGDSEVETEIRNNIVQNFAKKHLKPLVNEGMIKRVEREIENQTVRLKRDIQDKIKESLVTGGLAVQTTKNDWGRYNINLNHALKEELFDGVREEIKDKLNTIIKEETEKIIEEHLRANVAQYYDWYVSNHLALNLKERFDLLQKEIVARFSELGQKGSNEYHKY